jgi:hypothetical protein
MDYSSQGQGQQGMQQGVGMPWAYGMPGMLVGQMAQMGEGQAQIMVPMGSPEMVQVRASLAGAAHRRGSSCPGRADQRPPPPTPRPARACRAWPT